MSLEKIKSALKSGNLDVLQEFFENSHTSHDIDFLEFAAYHGNLDAVKFLVAKGFPPSRTTLFNAVFHGSLDVVRWIAPQVLFELATFVEFASSRGHSDVVRYFTEEYPAQLAQKYAKK